MARPLRIEYAGAWYHAMNRGLQKCPIFVNNQDRRCFLDILGEITQIFSIEVHAFSLMDNHYHLLLHTPAAGLSRAMRHLNGLYTQRFNKAHDRDGPLFRGRYKALLVDHNDYLTQLIRYIHRNPVEAGLCPQARQHPWTSHYDYLRGTARFSWLRTEHLLKLFNGNLDQAKKALDAFIAKTVPDEIAFKIKRPALNVIGNDGFQDWIRQNHLNPSQRETRGIPKKQKTLKNEQSPSSLLKTIALMHNISLSELRNSRYNNPAKTEAAYFLREILGLPLPLIAKFAGIKNENAVSQRLYQIRQTLKQDRPYAKQIKEKRHCIASQRQVRDLLLG